MEKIIQNTNNNDVETILKFYFDGGCEKKNA